MQIKNFIIKGLLCCVVSVVIVINYSYTHLEDTYEASMLNAIQKLNQAETEIDYNRASSQFYEIAKLNRANWLPYYYSGLCKTLIIFKLQPKEIDRICDEAYAMLNKSDSLNPNNSEIFVLKSMNYSARLSVNPASRANKYNKLIYKTAEQAIKFDPTNPRAYLQKGQYIYHTPINFGGGATKALPVFEEALSKYSSFKVKTTLMPNWGKNIAEKMISTCKKEMGKRPNKSGV
jgi:hypothetical protein